MLWQSVSAQSNIFYDKTFTLASGSGGTCYYYASTYVYNSAGSTVVGSITSQGKVDFFIMNSAQEQQFIGISHKGACLTLRPQLSEIKAIGITSYSINYLVPDNGNHYFLFFNSYTSDAVVSLVLGWAASPTTYQPAKSYNYVTNTPYSYQSTTNLGTVETTSNPYPLLMVGIVSAVLAVVLIAVVYPMIRKKPHSDQTAPKIVQEQNVTKPSQVTLSKQFCVECGSDLQLGSKFCNKCGTKQP